MPILEVCSLETLDIKIKALCDETMKKYIETKQYDEEQESIEQQMEALRNSLNEVQRKQLNQLLDSINKDDSQFSYEAFYRGILWGMKLNSKTPAA